MTRVRAVVVLAALAVVLGAAAGCSSSSSDKSSSTTTSSKQSFAIDTPKGQVSLSLDGQLPPNWPKSFPVPDGATPAGSGSLGGSDQTYLVGAYTTKSSASDTFDFYKTNSSLTVKNPKQVSVKGKFLGSLQLTGSDDGYVVVTTYNGETLIVVELKTGGTGSSTSAADTTTTTSM